jgi:hypothetical protein
LVFFIRFLKTANKLNLLVYSTLMMFLVFSHANTWTIFAMFEGLYLVVMYKMNHYQSKNIIFLLVIVISSVAIDIARSSLTATSGVASDIVLAQTAGTGQLSSLWSNLVDTTKFFSGGQFSNFIIFALGVFWLFRSDLRQVSNIFILVFLALAVLPLLVGDSVIQSRVFYDIPFQIPAAIGLTYLWRNKNKILVTMPICIWIFIISIRMVTNFYYISPS